MAERLKRTGSGLAQGLHIHVQQLNDGFIRVIAQPSGIRDTDQEQI